MHAFCKIDTHGNVSPRAWGPDGNAAGVFNGGPLGGGVVGKTGGGNAEYEADHNSMEGYNSEGGSAVALGAIAMGEGDWTIYYDDQNIVALFCLDESFLQFLLIFHPTLFPKHHYYFHLRFLNFLDLFSPVQS